VGQLLLRRGLNYIGTDGHVHGVCLTQTAGLIPISLSRRVLSEKLTQNSPLFEIALVLVRFDHFATVIRDAKVVSNGWRQMRELLLPLP
jgi:hypothetical protein